METQIYSKVSGKRRAAIGVPKQAKTRLSSASPSNTRRGAKVSVPKQASQELPRAESPKSRGRATRKLSARTKTLARAPESSSEFGTGGHSWAAISGHGKPASGPDLSVTIAWIRRYYEQRRDLLSTASGLTNRLKALTKARRKLATDAKVSEKLIEETAADYPPLFTLLNARAMLRDHIGKIEKQLGPRAERLPGYASLWEPVKGLGPLGLTFIIGEAGDLSEYSTHSKLWRRFGLHVGGGKAFYVKRSGMTAADWQHAGYCPRRRSLIYQLVDSLMKQENRYRTLRDERREIERAKAKAEGLKVAPAAKIPKAKASEYRSEGHILNRANRYVGKKLLRDLWKVWRREAAGRLPKGQRPDASRSPSNPGEPSTTEMPARASTRMAALPTRS